MEPLKNKHMDIVGFSNPAVMDYYKTGLYFNKHDVQSALLYLKEKLDAIKKQRVKKKSGKTCSGGSSLSYQKTIFFIDKAFEDVVNERQKRNDKTKSRL